MLFSMARNVGHVFGSVIREDEDTIRHALPKSGSVWSGWTKQVP